MPTAELVAVRLAKEGYGNPESILEMSTNLVLSALDYCQFSAEYERAHMELNKPADK